jgi:hypothetical protein
LKLKYEILISYFNSNELNACLNLGNEQVHMNIKIDGNFKTELLKLS